MTILLPSKKRKVIGLDISSKKVIGVVVNQLSENALPLQVLNIECNIEEPIEFRIPPYVLEQLQDFVNQFKLHGEYVVLSIPNHQVMVRYLDMPSVPRGALRQAVQVDIGTTIHLPFDDPVFDVVPVPTINSNYDSLDGTGGCCLVVSPRTVINNITEFVKQAGLIPYAVDIKPLAILRAAGIIPHSREELTLLLHLRVEDVSLSIFIGSHLYFFRNMDIGIPDDLNNFSQIESFVSDIVYEINRVISFFNFNLAEIERPIGFVYLYTTHPSPKIICTEMERQLGSQVTTIDNYKDDETMVAMGLAMKRWQKQ